MILSLLYNFFKEIKPMNVDSRLNKTLGWLRQNAKTKEDKLFAEELHDKILLELYQSHVNHTGDTYYPPLQQELIRQFEVAEGYE